MQKMWRAILKFLGSEGFHKACAMALTVVVDVEEKAKAIVAAGGTKMSGRDKLFAAADSITGQLNSAGDNSATIGEIIVAIEMALEHYNYFKP